VNLLVGKNKLQKYYLTRFFASAKGDRCGLFVPKKRHFYKKFFKKGLIL